MASKDILLSEIGAFVPFPTALLDAQMPKLKDTEWRLLCVVVRQTLGWQSGKGRKTRDWMTQKQLMTRTGRNSAALSAALDSLVRKNLIECHDDKGNPLLEPQQRRRHRGRLYFSLVKAPTNKTQPVAAQREVESYLEGTMLTIGPRIYSGWSKADVIAKSRTHDKPPTHKN